VPAAKAGAFGWTWAPAGRQARIAADAPASRRDVFFMELPRGFVFGRAQRAIKHM
jgi:hypothetical protein